VYNLTLNIGIFHHPLYRTFPYNKTFDFLFLQRCSDYNIPSDIIIELLLPELHTGFGRVGVLTALVSVPEATMNKNSCVILAKKHIRVS